MTSGPCPAKIGNLSQFLEERQEATSKEMVSSRTPNGPMPASPMRIYRMRERVSLILLLSVAANSCGEVGEDPRPPNVSSSAVLIHGPKSTGVWEECSLEGGVPHCKITNRKGLVVYDEIFTEYSGPAPRTSADLSISSGGGERWILLTNGTILIARSDEAT